MASNFAKFSVRLEGKFSGHLLWLQKEFGVSVKKKSDSSVQLERPKGCCCNMYIKVYTNCQEKKSVKIKQ